jgi:hypothetical protein
MHVLWRLPVLELKLGLSAFLGGHAGDIAVLSAVSKNVGAELRVNQNAATFPRHAFA